MRSAVLDIHRRYLRLLGVAEAPPSAGALREIVRKHLCLVPFENVSKLLLFERERAGRVTRLDEFLDGIEYRDLGGTCYSSNPFLAALLRALGYDAILFGADMSTPDVHTSVRVKLGNEAYHVDVGYAAPFYEPIPLSRLPFDIRSGDAVYRLESHPRGHEISVLVGGLRQHGYVVHPPAREWEFFTGAVVDSFTPGRTFMRCLRITRFFDSHTIELRNRRLLRLAPTGVDERRLDSIAELRQAIDREFRMPRCPIEQAVSVLERLCGWPFFGDRAWPDSV